MSEAVIIQFVFRKSASQSLNTGNIVTRSFTTYNYNLPIYQKFRTFFYYIFCIYIEPELLLLVSVIGKGLYFMKCIIGKTGISTEESVFKIKFSTLNVN